MCSIELLLVDQLTCLGNARVLSTSKRTTVFFIGLSANGGTILPACAIFECCVGELQLYGRVVGSLYVFK